MNYEKYKIWKSKKLICGGEGENLDIGKEFFYGSILISCNANINFVRNLRYK